MGNLVAYLFFNGNCGEALRFYERTLGGQLYMMAVKDSPGAEKFPHESGDRILHARLTAGSTLLMASDWIDKAEYPGMSGFRVCLTLATRVEAESLFFKLSEGGQVTIPFGKTFYSEGFGMCMDRFGTPWMVITKNEDQK